MLTLEHGKLKTRLETVQHREEGRIRRVVFSSPDAEVYFELKKSSLGGYSFGFVKVRKEGYESLKRLGRMELELMRRELLEGREHLISVGDVLVRVRPEALGYLFPKEGYTFLVRLLFRMWELGRKIKRIKR